MFISTHNKIEKYQCSKDVFIFIKTFIWIIQNTIVLLKIFLFMRPYVQQKIKKIYKIDKEKDINMECLFYFLIQESKIVIE